MIKNDTALGVQSTIHIRATPYMYMRCRLLASHIMRESQIEHYHYSIDFACSRKIGAFWAGVFHRITIDREQKSRNNFVLVVILFFR